VREGTRPGELRLLATPVNATAVFNKNVHNAVEKASHMPPKLHGCKISSRVHRSECSAKRSRKVLEATPFKLDVHMKFSTGALLIMRSQPRMLRQAGGVLV